MTSEPATFAERALPAPPEVPSPADFPAIPVSEPPGPPSPRGIGLAVALLGAVTLAAAAKWISQGSIETAPLLFIAAAAAAWWLDRQASLIIALAGAAGWSVATFLVAPGIPTLVNVVALAGGLIGLTLFVAGARAHERATKIEQRRRDQARMILAVQLRESVVSIDVAVPLLADPMKLDRTQGAAYDHVRRHARNLTRLATDLLTVDQVDMRRMSLTMVPIDLAAFVLEIAEQRVPRDRATIVAPSMPVQVSADPERLRQLIDHLLQNALKFSPSSAGIMVDVTTTADEARVSVRDHGVGLSLEDHKVLFTRYGRIRDARTANVAGMGLGLYIARLIAEAHGGELTASSAGRGLGATFTLSLPLLGRPPRPRPQRAPSSSFWD